MFTFFIKEENWKVFGTLKSLKYKASPISSEGLEVRLSLTFSRKEKWVIDTKEEFVENFYSFEYSANLHSISDTNGSDDEEDNDYETITLETEDVEDEIDEPEQIDLEIDMN